jgi:hypothetical protein
MNSLQGRRHRVIPGGGAVMAFAGAIKNAMAP